MIKIFLGSEHSALRRRRYAWRVNATPAESAPSAAPRVKAATPSFGTPSKARLRWELGIVLALSFGAAGVRAIVSIIEAMNRDVALAAQTATINRPMANQEVFDLIYQLLSFVFGLAPVALVAFLLWQQRAPHLALLGLGRSANRAWWARESGYGVLLAAVIGIPGLIFYVFAREVGMNVNVVPAALNTYWWTVPVLILMALKAALGEELIVVAYFFDRMKRLGVGPVATIIASALLRGSYHLYQGFGGFLGNVVMGLVFGWAYQRWGRALPLVVAHLILDIVSFVGYPLAVSLWPQFFGAG